MNVIKALARCVGQYKKDSLLSPFFIIFEVILEVLIPLLVAFLIDFGIEDQNMDMIFRIGVALIVSVVFSLTSGVLAGHFAARAAAGFARNLRQSIFYSIQNFSFYNIDKFSAPSLITRSTTDITHVQMAYQMIIRVAIRGPVMLVFSLAMAFNVNRQLSLIFLFAIPFLGLGMFLIIRFAHPLFVKVFRTIDKLNGVVQENLRGIRVVKSFVREDFEKRKFKDVSQTIFNNFTKAEKLVAFNGPLMQFSMYSCILLLSWFGANLIVADSMTTGQLVSLISYSMQILMSLMMLSMIFVMVIISRASAERIAEVLQETSDLKNPEKPIHEVEDGTVTFENVQFGYAKDRGNLCLKDINLSIQPGQHVGIIGGTGSAKSTLVQMIPRLYDVLEGQVKVGGVDVRSYDLVTLRDAVGMVLQKNVLFSGTIKENLRWGDKDASDEDLMRVCKIAQAHDFIMEFPDGYDTYIEQGGTNVSGGQRQRLCIARALLKKPKILILDDSTSAVDTKTDAMIRRGLQEEVPDTTVLIIAQRVMSVMDADKIIIMEEGRVDAFDTHENLLDGNDIYREVYDSQQNGGLSHGIA